VRYLDNKGVLEVVFTPAMVREINGAKEFLLNIY